MTGDRAVLVRPPYGHGRAGVLDGSLAFCPVLAGIHLGSVVLTQAVKTRLLRKGWVTG